MDQKGQGVTKVFPYSEEKMALCYPLILGENMHKNMVCF